MSAPLPDPPRLARWLLARLLPGRLGDDVAADLHENFVHRLRVERWAVRRARRAYWREIASLDLLRLRRLGATEMKDPPRSRMAESVHDWLTDGRITLRRIRRRPLMAALVVLVMGGGITIATALFAIVQTVLIDPLPYRAPQQLFLVWRDPGPPNTGLWSFTPFQVDELSRRLESIATFEGRFAYPMAVHGDGGAVSLQGSRVTPGFLQLHGVPPLLGRNFAPDDRNALIVSYATWQGHFGGADDIVGRAVRLEDLSPIQDTAVALGPETYTVIGVLPPDFYLPATYYSPHVEAQLFVPLVPARDLPNPRFTVVEVVARLADGVSLSTALPHIEEAYDAIQLIDPDVDPATSLRMVPMFDHIVGDADTMLGLLAMSGVLLLIIVASNTGSLFVARGLARGPELALRRALGAGRSRLARLVTAEAVVLAGMAAGVGMIGAVLATPWLVAVTPSTVPRVGGTDVGPTAFLFGGGVSVIFAALFALLMAASARAGVRAPTRQDARSGGGRPLRTQSAAVLLQIALTASLLVGSGLALQSVRNLVAVQPGYGIDNRLTFHVRLSSRAYPAPSDQLAVMASIHTAIGSVPGVVASGSSDQIPPNRGGGGPLFVSDDEPDGNYAGLRTVTMDYLEALEVTALEGRNFLPSDNVESEPVVLLSRTAADRLFPNRDALGRTITIRAAPWGPKRVVGIVPDLVTFDVSGEPHPEVYQLHEQEPWGQHRFIVHLDRDPTAAVNEITRAVWSVDPDLAIASVATLEELVDRSLAAPRFLGAMLGLFTGAALALSAVGTFGVLTYLVAQHLRDIAIRMALGAGPRRILRRYVSRVLVLAGAGNAIGLVGAIVLRRIMASHLYGIDGSAPGTVATSLAIVTGVALIAAAPALHRAARTEPASALRAE